MKEEILINSQIAFFFKDPIFQPEKIYQDIIDIIPELDVTPLVIPIPNEPQLYEVPIVQLKSEDGVYSFNIARKRCDLFIAGEGIQKFDDKKEKITQNADALFNYFSSKTPISRVAFVSRFFIEDVSQDEIISKLLVDEFKNIYKGEDGVVNPSEVFIRYIQKSKILQTVEINNFTSVERQSVNIAGKGVNIKGVQITRDFNTDQTKDYSEIMNNKILKELIMYGQDNFKLNELKEILWQEK